MESRIFARLNFDPGILVIGSLVATIILIIIVLLLLLRQSRLEVNYRIFMRGKGGRSLQEVFKKELESMDVVKDQTDLLHRRLTYVEKSLNRSYQKCGIVKYDAFKELGGQLSFALAMLNDSNTGFVINCIHSRDGSYTYIKDIVRGECAIELCDEEKEALKIALETAGSNPSLTMTEKKRRRSTRKNNSSSHNGSNTENKRETASDNKNQRTIKQDPSLQKSEKTKDRESSYEPSEQTRERSIHSHRRSASVKQAVINGRNDDE